MSVSALAHAGIVGGVALLLSSAGCGDDGPTDPRRPRAHEVEVVGFAYRPGEVSAQVGDTIRWIQRDAVPHTVTAGEPGLPQPAIFDELLESPGDVVEVELTREGTIPYFCRPHPFMTGTIVVTP